VNLWRRRLAAAAAAAGPRRLRQGAIAAPSGTGAWRAVTLRGLIPIPGKVVGASTLLLLVHAIRLLPRLFPAGDDERARMRGHQPRPRHRDCCRGRREVGGVMVQGERCIVATARAAAAASGAAAHVKVSCDSGRSGPVRGRRGVRWGGGPIGPTTWLRCIEQLLRQLRRMAAEAEPKAGRRVEARVSVHCRRGRPGCGQPAGVPLPSRRRAAGVVVTPAGMPPASTSTAALQKAVTAAIAATARPVAAPADAGRVLEWRLPARGRRHTPTVAHPSAVVTVRRRQMWVCIAMRLLSAVKWRRKGGGHGGEKAHGGGLVLQPAQLPASRCRHARAAFPQSR